MFLANSRNQIKEYLRDECPKALININSYGNAIDKKYNYKEYYNELYLYSVLREDSDTVSELGTMNQIGGLDLSSIYPNLPYYSLQGLSDAMNFGGATSFYRYGDR